MCRGDGQAGDVACGGAATSCPPGQFRRIVLLLRPGDTEWQEVGLVCLVGGAPTTVDDCRLGAVATWWSRTSLRSSRRCSQMGGTLIGLPAVFAAGQPRALGERQFTLVGLRHRAERTCHVDVGLRRRQRRSPATSPAVRGPNTSVSHTYGRAGATRSSVRSTWDAWFTVDGMGPWPVGGAPVVQVASPPQVRVVEARAELVVG